MDASRIEIDEFEIDEPKLTCKSAGKWILENYFSNAALKRRLPILQWLPGYQFNEFKGDLVAGLSIAFTLIPQALAMGLMADLPITYGLYSSIFGNFVYAIFGSSKYCNIGPTAIQAIFTASYVQIGGPNYAFLLAFISGVMQAVIGLLSLDFIVDFFSFPVTSAFINAASITVIVSQLQSFFGMPKLKNQSPNSFILAYETARKITTIRAADTILGTLCILFIMILKITGDWVKKWKNDFNDDSIESDASDDINANKAKKWKRYRRILKPIIYWTSLGRNFIIVVICSIIAFILRDQHLFTLAAHEHTSLPNFTPPQFTMNITKEINGTTYYETRNFGQILKDLTPGWFVMPLISSLIAISIPKAITEMDPNPISARLMKDKIPVKTFDPSQEIFALGITNLLGSCFKAFPIGVSLARSMISYTSGVKTQFKTFISGTLVVVSMLPQISPIFHYIPESTLSAVIMCAVLLMIKMEDFAIVYRTSFSDFILYVVTFVAILAMGLAFGVLTGVILNIIMLIFKATRPQILSKLEYTPGTRFPYVWVKPTQNIFYPTVDLVSTIAIDTFPNLTQIEEALHLTEAQVSHKHTKLIVVLDGTHIFQTDTSFVIAVKNFILMVRNKGVKVIFFRFRKPIRKSLRAGLFHFGSSFVHTKSNEELYDTINELYGTESTHLIA
ncbi:sodium-independent sulfate anion transporter-like protein [Dinothrombium tinctorium]|uniref:Sodium-independent sulfate anion transporter-like protein n=1 Tax=Dinothrombium tinctorium TaxID=1965070 RepID=A0A3S3PDN1_9ACAR|nr:sodium-independent sulfate anion transporter-like protein [Dinothrombium tinctorium]